MHPKPEEQRFRPSATRALAIMIGGLCLLAVVVFVSSSPSTFWSSDMLLLLVILFFIFRIKKYVPQFVKAGKFDIVLRATDVEGPTIRGTRVSIPYIEIDPNELRSVFSSIRSFPHGSIRSVDGKKHFLVYCFTDKDERLRLVEELKKRIITAR